MKLVGLVVLSVCCCARTLAAEDDNTVYAVPKPYSLDNRDNATVRAGRFDGKVLDLTAPGHPCVHSQCKTVNFDMCVCVCVCV